MTEALPWRAVPGGVELAVRLTPKGGRDRIEGVSEAQGLACLAARVAAPPVDGAANAALVRLLAKALGVPRSAVSFVSGETSRIKRLRIAGEAVEARLREIVRGR